MWMFMLTGIHHLALPCLWGMFHIQGWMLVSSSTKPKCWVQMIVYCYWNAVVLLCILNTITVLTEIVWPTFTIYLSPMVTVAVAWEAFTSASITSVFFGEKYAHPDSQCQELVLAVAKCYQCRKKHGNTQRLLCISWDLMQNSTRLLSRASSVSFLMHHDHCSSRGEGGHANELCNL